MAWHGAALGLLITVAGGCYDPPATWNAGDGGGLPDGSAVPDAPSGVDARIAPDARTACAPTYTLQGAGARYRRVGPPRTWYDAERDCEGDGGHLIVVNNATEGAYLRMQFATAGDVWLGLSDHGAEGTFRWVTGGVLSWQLWAGGEPNNDGGLEDCASQRVDGFWNDSLCGVMLPYLCECDLAPMPEPPTWCDTSQPATCGDCATSCGGSRSCTDQMCT